MEESPVNGAQTIRILPCYKLVYGRANGNESEGIDDLEPQHSLTLFHPISLRYQSCAQAIAMIPFKVTTGE